MARECKVETRFARRASSGKGIGVEEAVAAAQARIDDMRDGASARISEVLDTMQAAREAIASGDVEAMRFIHVRADAVVGLGELFGLHEVGQVAVRLCKLFDLCKPGWPTPEAVRIHLDALNLFRSASPDLRAQAAPHVLEGLRQVAVAAARTLRT